MSTIKESKTQAKLNIAQKSALQEETWHKLSGLTEIITIDEYAHVKVYMKSRHATKSADENSTLQEETWHEIF